MAFNFFKKQKEEESFSEDEYLEIDLEKNKQEQKILIKLFILRTYEEVSKILNVIREGYTICLIDIKPIKQKDSIELKRAVSKIKKTVEALEGHIAGHDNMIIVTPSFASIHKDSSAPSSNPQIDSSKDN